LVSIGQREKKSGRKREEERDGKFNFITLVVKIGSLKSVHQKTQNKKKIECLLVNIICCLVPAKDHKKLYI
jgi:hypothetical protein